MTLRNVSLPSSILALGLSLLSTAAHPAVQEAAPSPTAEEIVADSVAASGGKLLDSVRSLRRHARMHLEGDIFGVLDGTWEIAFVPGEKGFQKASFGDASTSIGWDGAAAWEESGAGLRDLDAEETALHRWLWELNPLQALTRDTRRGSLQRAGDQPVDGRRHYVLEYTDEHATPTRIYVDAETSLVSRLATSLDIPGLGRCAVTTDYSDYRPIGGVMLPQAQSQVIENLWVYRARFTETELNPELPEILFERPGASEPEIRRSRSSTGDAGMVSSGHELATLAGVEVLERGGNAFDAAVAVASTLTVVEPMMSSFFGGYGTLLVYDAESRDVRYLDNNGRFPAATDADVLRAAPDREAILRSAQAVSTPGNLRGFEVLWQELGSQPWAILLDSAIDHAESGFVVDKRLAGHITNAWDHFSDYTRRFYGREGEPLTPGDRLVQKDLARSLRLAADEGSGALYGGRLGRALVAEMERRGGFLAMEDLLAHRAEWFEPISIDYRGHEVVTAGPPSNSFAALVAMGIMSRYDNAALGSGSVEYLHRFAEATKHAFWARLKHAGGPELDPPPLDELLSEPYWQAQADRLDSARARPFEPPREIPSAGTDTTHFVVADRWGNVVSATITLGHAFGSAVMVEGTGIWLNNSLAYCTFEPPGNPMDALPGRRKHSSKSPAIILRRGRPWVAIGTPGGHTIPQSLAQMAINLLDFEMGLKEAIDTPRVAFAEPDRLLADETLAADVVDGLIARGHNVETRRGIGVAHGLRIDYRPDGSPSRFEGAADVRGTGIAVGLLARQRR